VAGNKKNGNNYLLCLFTQYRMGENSKSIWIDIKNSHEPLMFKSLMKDLPYEFYVTARDYAEVIGLLDKYGMKYRVVGKYHAKNKLTKALYLGLRSAHLALVVPKYDFFLSHGSIYGIMASKLRMRKSITIFDGDIKSNILKKIFKYSDYLILTKFTNYKKFGVSGDKVYPFDGFKEDIYIADLEPEKCPNEIPFKEYIIIRPEAYGAYYVSMEKSLVSELIKEFSRIGLNIVLLPRYPEERKKYKKYENVYIPEKPINGICGAYFAKAVLTGSGTLGREAACMGVPAVSFLPANDMLSVDLELIKMGRMIHTRDVGEIVNYVIASNRKNVDLSRSKKVKEEVINHIKDIVER